MAHKERSNKLFLLKLFVFSSVLVVCHSQYQPTWESLDSRPLPSWYDEAKLGIFLHWGVFSVPSFGSAWFWYDWKVFKYQGYIDFMKENYKPGFTYADFAKDFTAEFYQPAQWAKLFNDSGARYVVLTSKHHEGFTNWPSNVSFNWNSMDVGPQRDLVGELATAIREGTNLHFGLYHSMFEWFHPLYIEDKANNFTTTRFAKEKAMPELYEIINRYKPEVLWSDGAWQAPDTYWGSKEFLAWLYNDSPVRDTVVTNDRWGKGDMCHHGGYLTCTDKYNPGTLQKRKFENAMTVDKYAWGYRRNIQIADILTIEELIETLIETVSCGGNLLVNVGPTKSGFIIPVFQERLTQLGQWMNVNGEAIYSSKPWRFQNDTVTPRVWYTKQKTTEGDVVYGTVLKWPTSNTLILGAPKPSGQTLVNLVGYPQPINWKAGATGGIEIMLPTLTINTLPSKWAWVFKFTNLQN
ncbi:hypothetical protein LOTGIDRAFT_217885 [Lottia gigantea]|uniref:alpha-L-fucosidase n=1 Tax=Lottia gigantea TaxID=225164 RepID=V4A629_LOTGI|nr:hypothetical protein LOTGIDRAFT_217885 [Lottia gigantea]ESO90450.1 hypothetical protein LOTGIDRAFT_217885 [Lottia gigantea]